jgi:Spy/CpxP family protein refolding chaperone
MFPTVHPALIHRWNRARLASGCGRHAGWGSGATEEFASELQTSHHEGGGDFGVRRPLRLLTYKLGLNETQIAEMARVLDELKTERAQAAVDDRRTLTSFADSIGGGAFDEALARKGADLRKTGADRLNDAVVKALGRIHGILDPAQREKFAYLIRTGVLVL